MTVARSGVVRPIGRRTGRRPGSPDTRQAIIDAATSTFAELGYSGATIRAIATRAGVDAALIHHYFGSKNELFLATVQIPLDPVDIVTRLVAGDREDLGERLVATLLTAWESPAKPALVALVRSALTDQRRSRMLRDFLASQVIGRMMRSLRIPPAEAEVRGSLLASQIIGLIVGRYVLAIEPLADLDRRILIATMGPTLQRYLTGELAEAAR